MQAHAKSRIDNIPQVRRKQKGDANDEEVGAVQIGEQMERQKMSASKSLTGELGCAGTVPLLTQAAHAMEFTWCGRWC